MDYSEFHVMIVDDDEAMRIFASMALEKSLNVSVTTASNPSEAFELMKTNMPDLMILDMAMPGMDGFSALKELRSHEETVELPVIVCTAVHSQELIKALFGLRIKDFVLKPLKRSVLLDKVTKILDGLKLDSK